MEANIIPLKGMRAITTSVTVTGNAPFIDTLAISVSGGVRYLDVKNDTVEATVGSGEEATLVIANTPNASVLCGPFKLTTDLNKRLDYQLQVAGATS